MCRLLPYVEQDNLYKLTDAAATNTTLTAPWPRYNPWQLNPDNTDYYSGLGTVQQVYELIPKETSVVYQAVILQRNVHFSGLDFHAVEN